MPNVTGLAKGKAGRTTRVFCWRNVGTGSIHGYGAGGGFWGAMSHLLSAKDAYTLR